MTVVQHLKQDVEHVGMCFLDLVKQNNRIRVCPHLITELSALLVSYISRRRTDHLGNRMFLHIFRHVYTDH